MSNNSNGLLPWTVLNCFYLFYHNSQGFMDKRLRQAILEITCYWGEDSKPTRGWYSVSVALMFREKELPGANVSWGKYSTTLMFHKAHVQWGSCSAKFNFPRLALTLILILPCIYLLLRALWFKQIVDLGLCVTHSMKPC